MIKKALAALVVVGSVWAPEAPAQMDSAYLLMMECNNEAMGDPPTFCMSYLDGLYSGANMDRVVFCPPRGMIRAQLGTLYAQYAKTQPGLLGVDGNRLTIAYAALKAGMPCGRGGNPAPRRYRGVPDPEETAYVLMSRCNPLDRSATSCMQGFVEGANIDRKMFCPHTLQIALPTTTGDKGQTVTVDFHAHHFPIIYWAYAQVHPELLNKRDIDVVRAAFKEAFPCN